MNLPLLMCVCNLASTYFKKRPSCTNGRFTFEQIHNTKGQIYFYERVESYKAKERMFKSFKWANFPDIPSDAGADYGFLEIGFICIRMWGSLCWFISMILNIRWKWNNLVSMRPNYFIFIGYLIAVRGTEQYWPLQMIQLSEYLFKGNYLEISLVWMIYPSALLTVWFSTHFTLRQGMISPQT